MRFSSHLSKSPIMPGGIGRRGSGKAVTSIHGLRHLLRRSRSEEGQTLIEFAAAALIFVALVFAICDFGRLFFVKMEVENAIQEAARYGSTGNHLPVPGNPGVSESRVDSITNTLTANLTDLTGAQLSNIQVSSAKHGTVDAGGPGDMMTLAGTVNIPLMTPFIALMFPGGQYTYIASVTVMNEPFPTSQTK